MNRYHLHLIVLFITLICAGCTHLAPSAPPSNTSWQTREALLSRIQGWQLEGKVGVQTSEDSGSASVQWIKNQGRYSVSLLGPLGSGGLSINGEPGKVVLTMSDGKKYTANNPESLLAAQWGFNLPLSNLNYWIRGLPVPNMPAKTQFDNSHRLSDLVQQGWHVQFLSYTQQDNIDLPSKLLITSQHLRAKIIIYSWKINV